MTSEPRLTDHNETNWQAVVARDSAYDKTFVYAVRSTGVYCRPSCPSRRAKRENISFFYSGAEARAAGFRACQRCQPDTDKIRHADAVSLACEQIRTADHVPDLSDLARQAKLSPGHFQRVFKTQVGLSPKQFALAERRKKLRGALAGATTVTQAIYDAGYATSSRAYADAKAIGLQPASLHKGAKGEVIAFAPATSTLGDMLIAATSRGLCFVEFGEPEALKTILSQRFPQARIEAADASFASVVSRVVQLIDTPQPGVTIPLDVRGTSFQERVWRALTAIPLGQTVSYTELAQRIGQATAARAVARACATNSLAVVVPCHRVVRSTGDISGYKWGVVRKRELLNRERLAKNTQLPEEEP